MKMAKSREISISPLHEKMEKGRDFFHFSDARKNRKGSVSLSHREMEKRSRNFHLTAAWKNGKKIEKFLQFCRDEE